MWHYDCELWIETGSWTWLILSYCPSVCQKGFRKSAKTLVRIAGVLPSIEPGTLSIMKQHRGVWLSSLKQLQLLAWSWTWSQPAVQMARVFVHFYLSENTRGILMKFGSVNTLEVDRRFSTLIMCSCRADTANPFMAVSLQDTQ
jgi:hypothetical protein